MDKWLKVPFNKPLSGVGASMITEMSDEVLNNWDRRNENPKVFDSNLLKLNEGDGVTSD